MTRSQSPTARGILLIGFDPAEAARISLSLGEAGHRGMPTGGARETLELVSGSRVDLALIDLAGAFAEVLGALESVRSATRGRCALLGVGSITAGTAVTDALRGLGLSGILRRDASPQDLVFRVNQILFADRVAANRISPRVPVDVPASFDAADGAAQGRILNLSGTGLFLSSDHLLPVNRSVTVRFALQAGAEPIAATCRVVWANAGGEDGQRYFKGMGLQFLQMRPASREALQLFLAESLAGLESAGVTQSREAEPGAYTVRPAAVAAVAAGGLGAALAAGYDGSRNGHGVANGHGGAGGSYTPR